MKIKVAFFFRDAMPKADFQLRFFVAVRAPRSKHLSSFTHAQLLAVPLLSNKGSLAIDIALRGDKNVSDVFLACVADKKVCNAERTFLSAIFCGSTHVLK